MDGIKRAGLKLFTPVYSLARRINQAFYRSHRKYSERDHRAEFMRRAFHTLGFNKIEGDYVEFGSHGGTTFPLAWSESITWPTKRRLWAFDSFEGLPEPEGKADHHPAWNKGGLSTSLDRFHEICKKRGMPKESYKVVVGFYEDTVVGKADDDPTLPTDIALVYIDCDFYSSTMSVLEFLRPRLKHGQIIAFDDYFCYTQGTISGERKAMLDTFTDEMDFRLLPYMQFGWHGMSFIVEDKRLIGAT